jgi:hypothetical protein
MAVEVNLQKIVTARPSQHRPSHRSINEDRYLRLQIRLARMRARKKSRAKIAREKNATSARAKKNARRPRASHPRVEGAALLHQGFGERSLGCRAGACQEEPRCIREK